MIYETVYIFIISNSNTYTTYTHAYIYEYSLLATPYWLFLLATPIAAAVGPGPSAVGPGEGRGGRGEGGGRGQMLSSIHSANIKKTVLRDNPPNQDSTSVLQCCFLSDYQTKHMIPGSIHTHCGIRVQPKTRNDDKLRKCYVSLK